MSMAADKLSATIKMSNGFMVTPKVDSMQLQSVLALLTDKSANSAHIQSRIAPVEGTRKNRITVIPSFNPYVEGTQVSDKVKIYYQNVVKNHKEPGFLVAIRTRSSLTRMNDGTYGSVKVYDAVGNIVAKNIPVYQAATELDYGFVWNCKNQQNRIVNSGTYYTVVSVNDEQHGQYIEKIKLGYKRKNKQYY